MAPFGRSDHRKRSPARPRLSDRREVEFPARRDSRLGARKRRWRKDPCGRGRRTRAHHPAVSRKGATPGSNIPFRPKCRKGRRYKPFAAALLNPSSKPSRRPFHETIQLTHFACQGSTQRARSQPILVRTNRPKRTFCNASINILTKSRAMPHSLGRWTGLSQGGRIKTRLRDRRRDNQKRG